MVVDLRHLSMACHPTDKVGEVRTTRAVTAHSKETMVRQDLADTLLVLVA
jgi:hypothetical protein